MKKNRANFWILLSIFLHVLVIGAVLYTPIREALVEQFIIPEEPEAGESEKEDDPEKVEKIKKSIVESKKRVLLNRLDELYAQESDLIQWRRTKLAQWLKYSTDSKETVGEMLSATPDSAQPFPLERVQLLDVVEVYREAIDKDESYRDKVNLIRGLDLGLRFEMPLTEALETADIQRKTINPEYAAEMKMTLADVESIKGVEAFAEAADKAIREVDMAIQRTKDFISELRQRDLAQEEGMMADLPPTTIEEMELPEIDLDELLSLTPEELAELAAAQLAHLSPEELARLSADQLAALTAEQLAALSLDQLGAFDPSQLGEFDPDALQGLSTAQLAQLASMDGLSGDQREMLQAMMAQSLQGEQPPAGEMGMELSGPMPEGDGTESMEGEGQTLAEIMAGMSPAQRQLLMRGAATQQQNGQNISDMSQIMRAAAMRQGTGVEGEGDDSDMTRYNVGQYPLFPSDYAVPSEQIELIPRHVVTANAVPARRIVIGESQTNRRGIIYVDSWYMIGPFENDGIINFDRTFPPSIEFDLDAEYQGKFDLPVRWNFVQTDEIKQPVYPLADRAVYYAYTELYFEEPTEIWVAFGSDDGAKFWINETLAFQSRQTRHTWQIFEGHRKVFFKQGRNEVKARVETSPGVCFLSMILLPITERTGADDDS